jgi:hypothetical protein
MLSAPITSLVATSVVKPPCNIQLRSIWKNAEDFKFHRFNADSGLLYPDEEVIEVSWWWVNIVSTINGKPEKGLSAS